MPVMKPKDKKRRLKQKQKQKQVVKTNVKVSVQSSGGSGGGGSSQGGAMPSMIPSAFNERQLDGILQQIAQRIPVRQNVPVNSGNPIQSFVEPPRVNPANDNATLRGVFSAPINFNEPIKVGGVSKGGENTALEEMIQRYRVEPIDTTGMSEEEFRAVMATTFAREQEFIIQPKPRGRKLGSKNKPKTGGGAASE